MPDDVIWSVMANQEQLALADLLSTLRPVTRVGLYYPQASLIDAPQAEAIPLKHAQLLNTLADIGYQVQNFSFRDIGEALGEVQAVILPPAPYVEAEIVPKLRESVHAGGNLLAVTVPAIYDEHLQPLNAGRSALANVIGDRSEDLALRHFGKGRVIFVGNPMGFSFGQQQPAIDLHRRWRFRLGASWRQIGTRNTGAPTGNPDTGLDEHWEAPEYEDSAWEEVPVPGTWEDHGYPDHDGYGWYRLSFELPTDLAGKRLILGADTLDHRAWVYVNGHLVRKTKYWDEGFRVDVSACLRHGERNVLALRILDTGFRGGVRGPVTLTCHDVPSDDRKVLMDALGRLGLRPEASCSASGIVRRLMVDGAGHYHLLYANETNNSIEADIKLALSLKA